MTDMPGAERRAAALQEQFGRPGVVAFEVGPGGLVRATVATATAEAHVFLHGAHVTRFARRGEPPLLFLSGRSAFAAGRAIRGGVPIVFPWFGPKTGDPTAPQHGFARTAEWAVEAAGPDDHGGAFIELGLAADAITRAAWPFDFRLRYRVHLGGALALSLSVANEGAEAFDFEEALHTYLAVGDVRAVSVGGLESAVFIDKVDGFARRRHGGEPVRLAGETDRVFLDTEAAVVVEDPVAGRRVTVVKAGSRSTVIWNPWAIKAAGMADLDAAEWREMLCVEAANAADNRRRLASGEHHELSATFSTSPLPSASR